MYVYIYTVKSFIAPKINLPEYLCIQKYINNETPLFTLL
jgi:hypothetical protein